MDTMWKALKKTELFSDLPNEVILQEVMPCCQLQEYRKGVFLIEQQQKVNRFGIVLSGKIHILHIFPEGNYSLMSALTIGDLLGADLISTRSRISPYYAMAATPARVLYFPAELLTRPGQMEGVWQQAVRMRLLTWVSNENMKKEYRLAILSQKGLRERIWTYLTMQSLRLQRNAFAIPFTREEMAAFLCVNRSALSHELSRMQQEGLLTFHKNFFSLTGMLHPEEGDRC